jgi:hypothetical protein
MLRQGGDLRLMAAVIQSLRIMSRRATLERLEEGKIMDMRAIQGRPKESNAEERIQ